MKPYSLPVLTTPEFLASMKFENEEIPIILDLTILCFLVECPAGSYEKNGRCVLCPRHTFQSDPGKTECVSCGPYNMTEHIGATSSFACIDRGNFLHLFYCQCSYRRQIVNKCFITVQYCTLPFPFPLPQLN